MSTQETEEHAEHVEHGSPHHRIPLWLDLRDMPVNKRLPMLKAAKECGVERVILGKDDPHLEREDLHPLLVDGRNAIKDGGTVVGRYVKLRSGRDQDRAAAVEGIVIVDSENWTIIPLENLIAARRDQPDTLFALARTPAQARLFRDTLEIGVHGIALVAESPGDIREADRVLRSRGPRTDDRPNSTLVALMASAREATQGRQGRKRKARVKASVESVEDEPAAASDGDSASQAAEAEVAAEPAKAKPGKAAKSAKPTKAARPHVDQEGHAGPSTQTARSNGSDVASDFLEVATVTAVEDAGPGDRVCIDTTSLFRPGEGLLIGSTARGFCLVHAETIESEYVRARPFRVNAGAVHSYLFAPGGKTRYLSELAAGAQVLAVHPDGVHRVVTVGRAKIERRPHSLITWRTGDDQEGNAVLQTAETIRLVRPDGSPVAVTELAEGDEILVHTETAARHFGMPVEEFLEER